MPNLFFFAPLGEYEVPKREFPEVSDVKGFCHVGRGELHDDLARLGGGGGVERAAEAVLLGRRDEGRGQGVGHERLRRDPEPEVAVRGEGEVKSIGNSVCMVKRGSSKNEECEIVSKQLKGILDYELYYDAQSSSVCESAVPQ